jgi:hypothetical protein
VKPIHAVLMLSLVASFGYAIEAKNFKRITDRMGNKLIEQFDFKNKCYGTGAEQKDADLAAIIVLALCTNPREYRESHGPFVSEPVKLILSKIKPDGSIEVDGKAPPAHTVALFLMALHSTENEEYHAVCEKLKAQLGEPHAMGDVQQAVEQLEKFTSLNPHEQAHALAVVGHALRENAKQEVKAGGTSIAVGQFVLDLVDKLEAGTGMISPDLRVDALGLAVATKAYKELK